MMWDIAAKVTLVALFAIMSVVSVLSVLGTAMFSPVFLALTLGLTLAMPVLFHIERKLANRAEQLKFEARVEEGVANHLLLLKNWSKKQFDDFYRKHRIPSDRDPNLLQPLIARYNFWKQTASRLFDEASLIMNEAIPGNPLINQPTEIKNATYLHFWKILKELALPAKLESAFTLRLLKNPFQEISLAQIGRCHLQLDYPFIPGESEEESFFEFSNHAPSLCVREIINNSDDELSQKLQDSDEI